MRKDLAEIVFILDRSGSMTGLEEDTIGGYNSFLKKQQGVEGEANVTTVLFDDKYEVLHDCVDLKKIEPITDKEYFVRGATALLDAIGKSITSVGQRINKTSEAKKPAKVIFVITTDGMENSSREYNYKKIKGMITHQQKKYSWEFIFMGANMDAVKEGANLGIRADRSINFAANSDGIEKMYSMSDKLVYFCRRPVDDVDNDTRV
jgi:uncharacterized protein YegL